MSQGLLAQHPALYTSCKAKYQVKRYSADTRTVDGLWLGLGLGIGIVLRLGLGSRTTTASGERSGGASPSPCFLRTSSLVRRRSRRRLRCQMWISTCTNRHAAEVGVPVRGHSENIVKDLFDKPFTAKLEMARCSVHKQRHASSKASPRFP